MRRFALLFALLTLSAALCSPPVAATDARPGSPDAAPVPAVTAPDDPPRQLRLSAPANTTVEIQVHGNRSARWTVTATYTLESSNETAAFRQYADDYRNGETDQGPTADLFRRIVDSASTATGRQMTVRNVERRATVGNETGTVSLSFVWTGMLERTGNRTIRLDDAVLFPRNRTWLGTLESNQTLVVHTPEGYSVVDSEAPSFDLRNNSVVISGPAQVRGNLDITYRRTTTPESGLPSEVVAGAVLVGAFIVALAVYLRRREDRPLTVGTGDVTAASSTDDRGSGPDAADAGGDAESAAAAETEAADDAEADAPAVDPELLSDEERVEHLLRENGGRMKQATIVSETGWSDAKVSQLLSSMADEGRVNKLRLGRENLISLPDEDEDEDEDAT